MIICLLLAFHHSSSFFLLPSSFHAPCQEGTALKGQFGTARRRQRLAAAVATTVSGLLSQGISTFKDEELYILNMRLPYGELGALQRPVTLGKFRGQGWKTRARGMVAECKHLYLHGDIHGLLKL